jgi:hypothetical protein
MRQSITRDRHHEVSTTRVSGWIKNSAPVLTDWTHPLTRVVLTSSSMLSARLKSMLPSPNFCRKLFL